MEWYGTLPTLNALRQGKIDSFVEGLDAAASLMAAALGSTQNDGRVGNLFSAVGPVDGSAANTPMVGAVDPSN